MSADFYQKYAEDEQYVQETVDYLKEQAEDILDANGTMEDVFNTILEGTMIAPVHNIQVYFSVLVTSRIMDMIVQEAGSASDEV